MAAPDQQQALSLYRDAAAGYDSRISNFFPRYRRRAVDRLQLQPGDAVLDVACGTGANFGLLLDRVGETGRVVGVDLSPDMLAVAAGRLSTRGWPNVELLEGAVGDVPLHGPFDAALFSLTHDVLQSERAVLSVCNAVRPGGRVASFGAKQAPGRWRAPVNWSVRRISRRYVTTFDGFDEPWRNLARAAPGLTVEPVALGGAYIASASIPAPAR